MIRIKRGEELPKGGLLRLLMQVLRKSPGGAGTHAFIGHDNDGPTIVDKAPVSSRLHTEDLEDHAHIYYALCLISYGLQHLLEERSPGTFVRLGNFMLHTLHRNRRLHLLGAQWNRNPGITPANISLGLPILVSR